MKCLLNPTTGEVRRADPATAKVLRGIGWTYCTKTLWRTYRNRDMVSRNALEVKAERGLRRV